MIDSSIGYPPNLGTEVPAVLPEIPELESTSRIDNKLQIWSRRSFMEEISNSVLLKVQFNHIVINVDAWFTLKGLQKRRSDNCTGCRVPRKTNKMACGHRILSFEIDRHRKPMWPFVASKID